MTAPTKGVTRSPAPAPGRYGAGIARAQKQRATAAQSAAASTTASTPSAGGRYDWNDKKGAIHSIPLAQHQADGQSLTAPPTYRQTLADANSAADLQYGPQIQASQQLQSNLPSWFSDYLARVAGYAKTAQAQSAPVVQQAQDFQAGTGQATPGIDPNSAAGQTDALAAKGRQALAALGADALKANAQSTQDYFGGMGALGARELPAAQAAAAQGTANAQSQRAALINSALGTARQNAQNYAIARATLSSNTANQQADNALQVASLQQTAADRAASRDVTIRGQDISSANATTRAQNAADAAQKKAADKERAAQAKHGTAIKTASGGVQKTVTDILGSWSGYVQRNPTVDDTSKPVKKNGVFEKNPDGSQVYAQRKITPADVSSQLEKDNKAYTPELIHAALLIRDGKPLDAASIDYLHQLDPNVRIPRAWLRGDTRHVQAPKALTGPLSQLGGFGNPKG